MTVINDKQFYKDGLQFECTRCGNCCKIHGDHAYVYLTRNNIDEISTFLGMTVDDFHDTYCTKDEDDNVVLTMEDDHCNFLVNDKCTIYPVRPAQCSAWPILAEHLNEKFWNGILREFCPGIGKGKLYTKEELEAIALARENARE